MKFEELRKRKLNGEKLEWDNITKEQLKELFKENCSDTMIAELYGVTKSKVQYKRTKWDITIKNFAMEEMKQTDLFQQLNESSKDRLLDKDNMDILAKAITHYIFRNGPIEDMHSENKFSQKDMKTLNKYMVDHIATLLTCIYNQDWLKLEMLLAFYSAYGQDWDVAEPDFQELDFIYNDFFKNNGNSLFPTTIG